MTSSAVSQTSRRCLTPYQHRDTSLVLKGWRVQHNRELTSGGNTQALIQQASATVFRKYHSRLGALANVSPVPSDRIIKSL